MKIPFNNLKAQYGAIQSHVDGAIENTLHNFQLIRGPEVNAFEDKFAETLNIKNCINTGSGTDALFIILKALGIKKGDEVITPAFSWISSAEVITLCGATPVFADVDEKFYTLTVESCKQKITHRTKAVIAVHLFGQAADIVSLKQFCQEHQLWLIEDCAQAHLTQIKNQYAGTFGDAAAFSFYPTKNLGAYGDAGCITTNDDTLSTAMRRLANHGALSKDDHLIEGMNSRMDTLQAAILVAKLPFLSRWNQRRIELANRYKSHLGDIAQITLPATRPESMHTFHLFVIKTKQRDALKHHLESHGIQTIVHYPSTLPDLPAYAYLQHKPGDFPVSNFLATEVLSLPIHPELTGEEINYVSAKIREFYNK